jgi:tRNA (guanine-N7-)-methyltransferase
MSIAQHPHGPLRSFGRIKGRALKPRQARMMAESLPTLMLPDPALGPVDPAALMPAAAAVWLEIGFGGGEHLAAQADGRPDVLVLGVEPFLNGVASCVRHVEERGLRNVRLLQDDARALVAALPEASLDRIFILFPDPWPKARHHKRRLVQADFVADLARALKPGGTLRFATDWADYADWALQRFNAEPRFRWLAREAADWSRPPADHVTTRYETKGLGDCAPVFLDFERV